MVNINPLTSQLIFWISIWLIKNSHTACSLLPFTLNKFDSVQDALPNPTCQGTFSGKPCHYLALSVLQSFRTEFPHSASPPCVRGSRDRRKWTAKRSMTRGAFLCDASCHHFLLTDSLWIPFSLRECVCALMRSSIGGTPRHLSPCWLRDAAKWPQPKY